MLPGGPLPHTKQGAVHFWARIPKDMSMPFVAPERGFCLATALLVFAAVSCAVCPQARARAAAPSFVHASSYSFDAPTDLYLSEDAGGCDSHAQGLRPDGARVLSIVLYPDAYCSLMQTASCQYSYTASAQQPSGQDGHKMSRSRFTATWDNACTSFGHALADIVHGSIHVSEASDLGLQGSYDLRLADGSSVHGVFDSEQCAAPRARRLQCF